MKKLIYTVFFLIICASIFLLYNSFVPIAYHNDCKDEHIFRYQFGIYKIDSLGKKEIRLEQIGNAEDYFGFDKPTCIDAIYKYEQSLRKKEIDSINSSLKWRLIKANLYVNKNGEFGFGEGIAIGEGIFPVENYITKFGFNEGKELKSVIDTATFTELGGNYYKDKNHIYEYYAMAEGGSLSINNNVDYKTFKIIGDAYAKDKNHIYVDRQGVMENVDYKTFISKVGIGAFGKDKNGYYFWGDKIDTLNNKIDAFTQKAIKELNKK